MEKDELIRRAEDLSARCDRTGKLTHTAFLTPAERMELTRVAHTLPVKPVFHGGHAECERTAAFFLPYYIDEDGFTPDEYINAIHITAHFGEPGHRDYMGALLGMGIGANGSAIYGSTGVRRIYSVWKASQSTFCPSIRSVVAA